MIGSIFHFGILMKKMHHYPKVAAHQVQKLFLTPPGSAKKYYCVYKYPVKIKKLTFIASLITHRLFEFINLISQRLAFIV